MGKFDGKYVVVTGSSTGIGAATASYFAAEGAHVLINYYSSQEEGEATLKHVQAANPDGHHLIAQADVASEQDLERLFGLAFGEWPGIDIVVNNAGVMKHAPSDQMSLQDFRSVIDTNLTGVFMVCQHAIRHFLQADKPGVICNISSVHQEIPKPEYVGYAASKGGVENITRTLALEFADRNIRVNGVGPGATATPINDWADDAEARQKVANHIPMQRVAEPDEIARVVGFMCSDDASYITGQTLYVDGGLTIYPSYKSDWAS